MGLGVAMYEHIEAMEIGGLACWLAPQHVVVPYPPVHCPT
jgi:hypothetical protein